MTEVKAKATKLEWIELIVAILLGITSVATAWSAWQGGLHGSQMDQKYTKSNNLASEGNSEYNAGIQSLTQDMMLYNEINGLLIDQVYADESGDTAESEKIGWKVEELINANISEDMMAAFEWAMAETESTGVSVSPFEMEGFVESYFTTANELLTESQVMLEAGNANNTYSDNQGLVSVIYAVVLFLLGISTSFKRLTERYILLAVSLVGFLSATIYMFTIPVVLP